ncbi:hypothetical protein [Pontibacillus salipaludis]|uniref:Uncharacterized protein n=1 Tax=Pontibacillus salipaludis TaxID=1697394 RepID=A0ABQ1QCD4_9BACI|nr:hypothetical protein [Pontibacillus salipaludis]GGD22928.1 hypothetical protein GCM10011389_33350 [Pontibacillus salipaludis]
MSDENLKNIDEELENLSREEFIELLELSGFEVEDGDGKVIYTDIEKNDKHNNDAGTFVLNKQETIQYNLNEKKYYHKDSDVGINYFPTAYVAC